LAQASFLHTDCRGTRSQSERCPADDRATAHGDRLQVTLKARLRPLTLGLTPRSALEKFAAIQMVDAPADDRTLILSRYTEPNQQLLLDRLQLPAQFRHRRYQHDDPRPQVPDQGVFLGSASALKIG
jgi:hypothetical protein